MNYTHTPGPWTVDGPEVVSKKPPAVIAEVSYIGESKSDRAEREANARLIAAAPELLEALQNLLILYQGKKQGVWGESLNTVKKARAAIEKATA